YSRYPIATEAIRTFQHFRWADMPGALLPDDPDTPAPADWYSPEELAVFRLSSKNHVDVPVRVGRDTVHLLASHPTPPSFDGVEDRNGRRNHDEIRLWADYIGGGRASRYIYDDEGRHGGLHPGARFVIAGDLNADPVDGDSVPGAIQQLLHHPKVRERPIPSSQGGPEQAELQGGANDSHRGNPAFDTADFSESVGNLRVDYVLPRNGMRVSDPAVFWPRTSHPDFDLVGTFPFPSSDHRLVRIDVALPVGGPPSHRR
ncbi:MAG: endonuclease/exonuclease/phosphatase family protein, partial [Euzebyaceae bacterium]|nr:endonuclease/exonuclease/phosphatase family protein [Euzebyaceae bacterium]